jgi:hypothetical protein
VLQWVCDLGKKDKAVAALAATTLAATQFIPLLVLVGTFGIREDADVASSNESRGK